MTVIFPNGTEVSVVSVAGNSNGNYSIIYRANYLNTYSACVFDPKDILLTNITLSPDSYSFTSVFLPNNAVAFVQRLGSSSEYYINCTIYNGTTRSTASFNSTNIQARSMSDLSVAASNDGRLGITWSLVAMNNSVNVYLLQLLVNNGTVTQLGNYTTVGMVEQVPLELPGPTYTGVSYFSSGDIVITWSQQTPNSTLCQVIGEIFDSNGTEVGSEIKFSYDTTDGGDVSPTCYGDSSMSTSVNEIMIVVPSQTPVPQTFDTNAIYGQMYQNNGLPFGPNIIVNNATTAESAKGSVVTQVVGGGLAVSWSFVYYFINGTSTGQFQLLATQFYSVNGSLNGPIAILNITNGTQVDTDNFKVGQSDVGNILTAWTNGDAPNIIYTQKVAPISANCSNQACYDPETQGLCQKTGYEVVSLNSTVCQQYMECGNLNDICNETTVVCASQNEICNISGYDCIPSQYVCSSGKLCVESANICDPAQYSCVTQQWALCNQSGFECVAQSSVCTNASSECINSSSICDLSSHRCSSTGLAWYETGAPYSLGMMLAGLVVDLGLSVWLYNLAKLAHIHLGDNDQDASLVHSSDS